MIKITKKDGTQVIEVTSGAYENYYRRLGYVPLEEVDQPTADGSIESPEESLSEDCKVGTILGLYHEENDYIRLVASEAAQRRQTAGKLKKQPKLLCLHESIIESNLQVGDYTIINGKQYKVTGVVNIQEWNIIADISLEVVEDGNSIQL